MPDTGETGVTWCKSSYSGSENPQCVEVAADSLVIPVRDSKSPSGPRFTVGHPHWSHSVSALKHGELSA